VEKYCTAGQATGDNVTRSMRFACWIGACALGAGYLRLQTRSQNMYVRNTHYFPLQQQLHKRASMLRYSHIACLLPVSFFSQKSGSLIRNWSFEINN